MLQAETGAESVSLAASAAPEAVILDLGLPDRDGKSVLTNIRASSAVPIIVLSACDQEAEKIAALDLGGDDYVERPFGIGEFTARPRAARRHAEQRSRDVRRVALDDLVIDFGRRLAATAGAPVRLTPKE